VVIQRSVVRICIALFTLWNPVAAGQLPHTTSGIPHYYDEFNPGLKPWQPAGERNFEEVFKNYQYYAVVYADDEQSLTVTHTIKGAAATVTVYKSLPDGSLQPVSDGPDQKSRQQSEPATLQSEPATHYALHCATCHGVTRLGSIGPALLPSNLGRLHKEEAASVIREGRPATQMPPFGAQFNAAAISALVEFIYTPPAEEPVWGSRETRLSHKVLHTAGSLPDTPAYDVDPLNLFMVVEAGDHHVTVLDGDRLEPIFRFPTRFALHGGLKYSPTGRYVYLASRDGWITKFDLYNLKIVAEIRAGINTRNVAVSADGKTLLVGNTLPHSLVLLKAEDLSLLQIIPVVDKQGDSSRVSAVYQAAPRNSFVAALKDVPEVWEIMTDKPDFPIRRIRLERVLDDFFFDPSYRYLIGADRAQNGGQVIDLDTGKQVAELTLDGMPHLGSGITWEYQGRQVMATPNLKDGSVTVIDMEEWKEIARIKTLGPGFFMRSHENTPYAWTDVFFGANRDAMHVFDKRTLEMVKTVRPVKGKTSAHVEFTRDGRYALVSLWEMDGALVVYDANTLEEVKRIPMRKPSGKYNVYNKIHRSAGTSH
jgi:mono/diheme cytochrome c family protein/DNA-binding beta-propeller fold protein YncE